MIRLRRARADHGATMVEYALILALVVVVSLGAISRTQTRSSSELSSGAGRVGSSADNSYYAGVVTTTTSPSGTTTTTAAPTAVHPASLTATPASTNDGNKWIGKATVTVRDSSNQPVAGVLVQGDWTDPNPSVPGECTTTAPNGTCQLQRTDINDSKATTTFTIFAVSGTGVLWTPGAGDATSVTVSCPGSAATCD